MEAALQSLGACTGLVSGFYGEMSKSVDQLKISNVRWVRGAAGGATAGDGADRDGRWRQKREQYRYAQDEYRGPQMGGFPEITV